MHKVKVTKEVLKRLLTEQETAEYISLSRSFLRQGRIYGHRDGHIPPPRHIQLGRAVRYDIQDLDKWIEQFRSALDSEVQEQTDSQLKKSGKPKRGRRAQQEAHHV
jgi:predicted DNA-binding transcriptional regulator AlpA